MSEEHGATPEEKQTSSANEEAKGQETASEMEESPKASEKAETPAQAAARKQREKRAENVRSFHLDVSDQLADMSGYQEEAPSHLKEKAPRKAKKLIVFCVVLGIALLLSGGIILSAREVLGIGRPDKAITVDVPKSAGVTQVAEQLKKDGVIRSPFLFRVYYKFSKPDGSFRLGTYSLNSSMSYDAILTSLFRYSASSKEVTITFPEGMTLYQMGVKLEENDVCTAKAFLTAADNTDFNLSFDNELGTNKKRFHKLEGFFFPDTYHFYKNDNSVDVASKMLKNFESKLTPELKAKMKKQGFTLEQTMTIASIVQKEAGHTSEQKKVASVYFNRLKNKGVYPNLQSCPTRDYANELKRQMKVIDQDELDAYNTYEAQGLPPGPICNPGLEAIDATLSPDKTDYYYFCSNIKTGEFFYAKTLSQHEINIKKAGLAD